MKSLTASATLVFVVLGATATPALAPAGTFSPPRLAAVRTQPKRSCEKTFTVKMGTRAVRAVYAGTRRVHMRERRMLGRIIRCQRNPAAQPFLRAYTARHRHAWVLRRTAPPAPVYGALASWYEDAGATASGWHAYYGVANKVLPFGTRVTIAYGGREIVAVVDDRGPYVGGRSWDLNQNTAAALGFGGVGYVRTSIPG